MDYGGKLGSGRLTFHSVKKKTFTTITPAREREKWRCLSLLFRLKKKKKKKKKEYA